MADNLDPEQARQFAEALKNLTETTENSVLQQRGYIRDSEGNLQKLASRDKERAEIEAKFNQELKKQYGERAAVQNLIETNYKKMASEFKGIGDIAEFGKKQLLEMASGSRLATASIMGLEVGAQVAAAALQGAAKAAVSMAKSGLDGEKGMKVGARGITVFASEMNKGVQALGSFIVGIGAAEIAIAVLAAPFTGGLSLLAVGAGAAAVSVGTLMKTSGDAAVTLAELNERAAQQSDDLYKAFAELSKASMTGAEGMTGIFANLQKMGLTVAEFDKFKTVISANTKEMKMFGSTAKEGVDTFVDVAGGLFKSEMGKTLELMGITAEEQYEHAAKYMAQQTRFGLMQGKGVEDLRKGTVGYIEELEKVSALTGATRKEQEDARAKVMAVEQLRAGIIAEEAKARQTGDSSKLKEMIAGAKLAEAFFAMGLDSRGTAAAKYYGAGGKITDTLSAEFAREQRQAIDAIRKGQGSDATRFSDAMTAFKKTTEMTAKIGRYTNDVVPGLSSEKFANAAEAITRMANYEELKKKEQTRLGVNFNEDKLLADIVAGKVALDKQTQDQINLRRQQMENNLKLDKLTQQYLEVAGTSINMAASQKFSDAVDKFSEIINNWGKSKGNESVKTADDARKERELTELQLAKAREEAETIAKEKGRDSPEFAAARLRMYDADRAATKANMREQTAQHNKAMGILPRYTETDLIKMGLPIKTGPKGAVRPGGAEIDPQMLQLGQYLKTMPGVNQITSYNDTEHGGKGQHGRGKAIDFTLASGTSKEQTAKIIKDLQSMGLNVRNEYTDPSKNATGGHIHAEMIGPTIRVPKVENLTPKTETKDEKVSSVTPGTSSGPTPYESQTLAMAEMFGGMNERLDAVINKLGDSVDVQQQILQYSRA